MKPTYGRKLCRLALKLHGMSLEPKKSKERSRFLLRSLARFDRLLEKKEALAESNARVPQMALSVVSLNLATVALDAKQPGSAPSSLAVGVAARNCECERSSNLYNPTDSGAGRVESSAQPPFIKVTDEPEGETPQAYLRPDKGCAVVGAGQPNTLSASVRDRTGQLATALDAGNLSWTSVITSTGSIRLL